MEVNIKNEALPLCSGVCRTKSNFVAECDVIVPDSKPDILKVLQLSARPKVTSCETRSGHVIVSGSISFDILYLSDTEEKCVKSITASCDFSNMVREGNVSETMLTFADVDVRELDCNIANCRKLSLRASLRLNLQVYSRHNLDVISDIEGACTQKCEVSSGVICAHAQDTTIITDSFSLTSGKSPIKEILKADAEVVDNSIKVIDDKAIFKGSMRITVLYLGEKGLDYAQTEISFAHVLEADGIHENMDFEHTVKALDISASVSANDEGQNCIIDISAEIFMRVIARCSVKMTPVTDAYLPHGNLEIRTTPVSIDSVETVIDRDVDFREKIILPNDFPPIGTIYQVVARPFTESSVNEGENLRVSGYTEVYVLYLSEDTDAPICSYKTNVDFSVACPSPGCSITPVASCRLRNISYTINAENSIEIRGSVDVSVQCIKNMEADIVYSAEVCEYTPVQRPSIIVSCVSPGWTLWDIAKEYGVNQKDILLANALDDEDKIESGMALIIPK